MWWNPGKRKDEAAVREVERLGAALARQTGQEEDEAVRHLWGKLGMLLQRGNAAILANRVPSFPAAAIDMACASFTIDMPQYLLTTMYCLSTYKVYYLNKRL